ncbi:hypothetical protein CGC21_0420 [Leishmania donovani]|uniref:Uncharacterized protein n=1 Tax=Leishmania donovani TaxID=5661 RepID=A0A504XJR3_LEIDO|nr:hypothetical protein CGC21_0420 [Leishmania donovani]
MYNFHKRADAPTRVEGDAGAHGANDGHDDERSSAGPQAMAEDDGHDAQRQGRAYGHSAESRVGDYADGLGAPPQVYGQGAEARGEGEDDAPMFADYRGPIDGERAERYNRRLQQQKQYDDIPMPPDDADPQEVFTYYRKLIGLVHFVPPRHWREIRFDLPANVAELRLYPQRRERVQDREPIRPTSCIAISLKGMLPENTTPSEYAAQMVQYMFDLLNYQNASTAITELRFVKKGTELLQMVVTLGKDVRLAGRVLTELQAAGLRAYYGKPVFEFPPNATFQVVDYRRTLHDGKGISAEDVTFLLEPIRQYNTVDINVIEGYEPGVFYAPVKRPETVYSFLWNYFCSYKFQSDLFRRYGVLVTMAQCPHEFLQKGIPYHIQKQQLEEKIRAELQRKGMEKRESTSSASDPFGYDGLEDVDALLQQYNAVTEPPPSAGKKKEAAAKGRKGKETTSAASAATVDGGAVGEDGVALSDTGPQGGACILPPPSVEGAGWGGGHGSYGGDPYGSLPGYAPEQGAHGYPPPPQYYPSSGPYGGAGRGAPPESYYDGYQGVAPLPRAAPYPSVAQRSSSSYAAPPYAYRDRSAISTAADALPVTAAGGSGAPSAYPLLVDEADDEQDQPQQLPSSSQAIAPAPHEKDMLLSWSMDEGLAHSSGPGYAATGVFSPLPPHRTQQGHVNAFLPEGEEVGGMQGYGSNCSSAIAADLEERIQAAFPATWATASAASAQPFLLDGEVLEGQDLQSTSEESNCVLEHIPDAAAAAVADLPAPTTEIEELLSFLQRNVSLVGRLLHKTTTTTVEQAAEVAVFRARVARALLIGATMTVEESGSPATPEAIRAAWERRAADGGEVPASPAAANDGEAGEPAEGEAAPAETQLPALLPYLLRTSAGVDLAMLLAFHYPRAFSRRFLPYAPAYLFDENVVRVVVATALRRDAQAANVLVRHVLAHWCPLAQWLLRVAHHKAAEKRNGGEASAAVVAAGESGSTTAAMKHLVSSIGSSMDTVLAALSPAQREFCRASNDACNYVDAFAEAMHATGVHDPAEDSGALPLLWGPDGALYRSLVRLYVNADVCDGAKVALRMLCCGRFSSSATSTSLASAEVCLTRDHYYYCIVLLSRSHTAPVLSREMAAFCGAFLKLATRAPSVGEKEAEQLLDTAFKAMQTIDVYTTLRDAYLAVEVPITRFESVLARLSPAEPSAKLQLQVPTLAEWYDGSNSNSGKGKTNAGQPPRKRGTEAPAIPSIFYYRAPSRRNARWNQPQQQQPQVSHATLNASGAGGGSGPTSIASRWRQEWTAAMRTYPPSGVPFTALPEGWTSQPSREHGHYCFTPPAPASSTDGAAAPVTAPTYKHPMDGKEYPVTPQALLLQGAAAGGSTSSVTLDQVRTRANAMHAEEAAAIGLPPPAELTAAAAEAWASDQRRRNVFLDIATMELLGIKYRPSGRAHTVAADAASTSGVKRGRDAGATAPTPEQLQQLLAKAIARSYPAVGAPYPVVSRGWAVYLNSARGQYGFKGPNSGPSQPPLFVHPKTRKHYFVSPQAFAQQRKVNLDVVARDAGVEKKDVESWMADQRIRHAAIDAAVVKLIPITYSDVDKAMEENAAVEVAGDSAAAPPVSSSRDRDHQNQHTSSSRHRSEREGHGSNSGRKRRRYEGGGSDASHSDDDKRENGDGSRGRRRRPATCTGAQALFAARGMNIGESERARATYESRRLEQLPVDLVQPRSFPSSASISIFTPVPLYLVIPAFLRWAHYDGVYQPALHIPAEEITETVLPAGYSAVYLLGLDSTVVVPDADLSPYDPHDTAKASHPAAALGVATAQQILEGFQAIEDGSAAGTQHAQQWPHNDEAEGPSDTLLLDDDDDGGRAHGRSSASRSRHEEKQQRKREKKAAKEAKKAARAAAKREREEVTSAPTVQHRDDGDSDDELLAAMTIENKYRQARDRGSAGEGDNAGASSGKKSKSKKERDDGAWAALEADLFSDEEAEDEEIEGDGAGRCDAGGTWRQQRGVRAGNRMGQALSALNVARAAPDIPGLSTSCPYAYPYLMEIDYEYRQLAQEVASEGLLLTKQEGEVVREIDAELRRRAAERVYLQSVLEQRLQQQEKGSERGEASTAASNEVDALSEAIGKLDAPLSVADLVRRLVSKQLRAVAATPREDATEVMRKYVQQRRQHEEMKSNMRGLTKTGFYAVPKPMEKWKRGRDMMLLVNAGAEAQKVRPTSYISQAYSTMRERMRDHAEKHFDRMAVAARDGASFLDPSSFAGTSTAFLPLRCDTEAPVTLESVPLNAGFAAASTLAPELLESVGETIAPGSRAVSLGRGGEDASIHTEDGTSLSYSTHSAAPSSYPYLFDHEPRSRRPRQRRSSRGSVSGLSPDVEGASVNTSRATSVASAYSGNGEDDKAKEHRRGGRSAGKRGATAAATQNGGAATAPADWRSNAKRSIMEQLTLYRRGKHGKPAVLNDEQCREMCRLLLDRAMRAEAERQGMSLAVQSNNIAARFTKVTEKRLKKSVDHYLERQMQQGSLFSKAATSAGGALGASAVGVLGAGAVLHPGILPIDDNGAVLPHDTAAEARQRAVADTPIYED